MEYEEKAIGGICSIVQRGHIKGDTDSRYSRIQKNAEGPNTVSPETILGRRDGLYS